MPKQCLPLVFAFFSELFIEWYKTKVFHELYIHFSIVLLLRRFNEQIRMVRKDNKTSTMQVALAAALVLVIILMPIRHEIKTNNGTKTIANRFRTQ